MKRTLDDVLYGFAMLDMQQQQHNLLQMLAKVSRDL